MAMHQARLSAIREEIAALGTTRTALRETVDALASGEAALGTAAFLSARGEDLRKAQAACYQKLAHAEAEMAELKDAAARARARADVLARLSREGRRR
jgi:exonuclease VII small subunit